MINCPNKSLKSWKDLVNNVGENKAYVLWNEYDGNVDTKIYLKETKDLEVDKKADNFLFLKDDKVDSNVVEDFADLNNFVLFNNQTNSRFTATEVLDNIKNNLPYNTEFTKELIDKLIPLLSNTKATVKFVSEKDFKSKDTLMQYDARTNTIMIAKSKLSDYNPEYIAQTFLHEVVHSVTVSSYNNPRTLQQELFKDFMDEMFSKYKALANTTDFSTEATYGFTSVEEFISEIMTNKEFQNEIKRLEKGSLWDQFLYFIRAILGLRKTSEYDRIIQSITDIISEDQFTSSNNIFEKKDFTKEPNFFKLDTIEKKLNYVVNGIKDNLEENIQLYDILIKRQKDPSQLKKHNQKLKDLLRDIESLEDNEQWKAISIFTNQLYSNLKSLQNRLNNQDFTEEGIEQTIALYDKYLQNNSLVEGLQSFISSAKVKSNLPITKDELNTLADVLETSKGLYGRLESEILAFKKEAFIEANSNRKFASEVIYKWKDRLSKEFDKLGYSGNKSSWINNQMMTTYKDEIDADVRSYVVNLVETPEFDISRFTSLFVSGINTNSKLVQLMQKMINNIRENILKRSLTKDYELKSLFDRFITEKGNKKPSELYKNILEYGKDGTPYLKGTYSIKFKEAYEEAKDKWDKEKLDKIPYKKSSLFKFIEANTVKDKNGKMKPIKKWYNDLSNLSKIEKEVLEEFKNITINTNKQTFGKQSLITKYLFGEPYYTLPSVTKSDLERVLEGTGKGIITDKWKDITSIRSDEFGYETYEEKNNKINGDPLYQIKVNLRGNIENDQRSLDLFTIYRLEYKNGVNFEEKHNAENQITTLVDIAKNKDFIRGENRLPVLGRFINRNNILLEKGENSNTYKRLRSLMEANVYDILHKNAGKIGGFDKNKIVRTLNGWTASVGMTLNEVTAAANVLNGKAQFFLEAIAGNYMTKKSIAKAEKIYFNKLSENLKDINSPIKTSFVNQVNDMFDTWGTVSVSAKQAFIKNGALKANLNGHSLQFMQESGEHWMQSTLTMAVLDGIKVMDANSKFLDKDGNITSEDKAASLLDMLSKNEKGILEVNPKVVYTTRSLGVKYNEGGKEMINELIKKKIFDTMGNYDANMQPEAMRHAAGKLVMMYRKFLIPMGITRFRGIAYFNKDTSELTEGQRFFSDALQEYEEGTYATTLRYVFKAILPAIKRLEFKILSSKWNELSDYEKKNIHKAVTEMMITMVLLPMISMLLNAVADGDDDDNPFIYFLLLQTRRLQSELASYRNWNEQYRILNSPIPSVNILRNGTNLIGRVFDPVSWNETYETGARKGQLKIGRDLEKILPILNSRNITYKEKYQFILNITQ